MKTDLQIREQQPGRYLVDGELTFATIDRKTIKALPFPKQMQQITLDLNQVTTTDSAGLALIMEWIKFARQAKIQLTFENIPEQLVAIAKLSGLESMIRQKNYDRPLS